MLDLASAKVRIIFEMARTSNENRRPSTIVRDNSVHNAYKEIMRELGVYAYQLPKSLIYEKLQERTGLCTKTIAYILNHTFPIVKK